jgi:hypothetical protein
MPRITRRLVDGLKAAGREFFVRDDKLIGFALRVQPSGVMSYVVEYRAGSGRGAPTRRMTIARVGKITPDEACDAARKLLGAVAHGADPAALRTAEKRAETLRELADLFLAEHAEAKRKGSTAAFYRDVLERLVLPELGNRKAEKVTTAELARLHTKMKDHPYQANRMLAVVGSLYSFAGKRHILPISLNPAHGGAIHCDGALFKP